MIRPDRSEAYGAIQPHQIPDEVVKVAANVFYNATGPTSRDDWREAIAAAINAWPEAELDAYPEMPHIILPLPQKGDT